MMYICNTNTVIHVPSLAIVEYACYAVSFCEAGLTGRIAGVWYGVSFIDDSLIRVVCCVPHVNAQIMKYAARHNDCRDVLNSVHVDVLESAEPSLQLRKGPFYRTASTRMGCIIAYLLWCQAPIVFVWHK